MKHVECLTPLEIPIAAPRKHPAVLASRSNCGRASYGRKKPSPQFSPSTATLEPLCSLGILQIHLLLLLGALLHSPLQLRYDVTKFWSMD